MDPHFVRAGARHPADFASRRPAPSRFTGVLLVLAAVAMVVAGAALYRVMTTSGASAGMGGASGPQRDVFAGVGVFLAWVLGDTTEAGFAHSALAGSLMIVVGVLVCRAQRLSQRWAGFPIAAGTGLFGWSLFSAGLALVLSNLMWGWSLTASGAWQPTFVSFVSVPPAVVLIYGPGFSVALTGAVLGAGLTTPLALAAVNWCCRPMGLPDVVGATGAMAVSGLLAFGLCRRLPWMPAAVVPVPRCANDIPHCYADSARRGPAWLVRRVLADLTEAQFIGNEWCGLALLLGTVANYLSDPASASSLGGRLPGVVFAQILAAALAVVLWRRQWDRYGWYPSFVPVVSVTPATVLTFGGTAQAVLAGAVLGAVAAPPLAAAIARRLAADVHPFIGNVAAMSISTTAVVAVLPLVPGFAAT